MGDFGNSRPVLAKGRELWGHRWETRSEKALAAVGAMPHLTPGFSWALAGSIRQYSGACLQPIPPQGPLSCSLRETQEPIGLLGDTGVVQRLGKLPLAPFPLPGPHAAPLAFWGPLWCWIPTNLGLLEVSIPCVRWRFPFLLCSRHIPLAGSPFLCVSHHTLPLSQLPIDHSSGQRHSSEMDPTCLAAAFPPPSSDDWGCPVSLAQGW